MSSKSSNIIRLCVDEDNPMGLYEYKLPPLPREKDIWYYDLPKKDQYWKTPAAGPKFPWLDPKGQIRNVKHMTEKEKIQYIEYWREKWDDGLWVMINGEPTYLTGMHVDHLVFNKFNNRSLFYDDAQRERFYFRDLTDKDNLCDGRLWAKGRRVGITTEEITNAIRVMISGWGYNIGAQSDTHPKAKMSIMSKIIDTYVRRVTWMCEVYRKANGKTPRTELELNDNTFDQDAISALGSIARVFPTTFKAMDGLEFMLVIMDELSKWVDAPVRETFEINIKTIVNPGKRGKMDLLSTTGDSDDAEKAVREWHKLIADSNPKVRNLNGKTNSGLYHYFVSYIHSFELWERYPQIKDKYGKVNAAMAEEIIWREVNQHPKDSKPYIFALYKMPTRFRHTLLTSSNQGYFGKMRISARLEELRGMPWDQKPYVVGSLEYDINGKVYFESNAERQIRCEKEGTVYVPGHWMVAQLPYFSIEKGIDLRNRYRKDKYTGICEPPINPEGAIGYDPIRYRKEDTTSTNLSDASIIVYKKHDYYSVGDENRYCALYLHRPDDPRDANRECIKACKFWGYPMYYERVMDAVKEDFEQAMCVPFMLVNPKDGIQGLVVDSGGKLVKNALDKMVTKFSLPKSENDRDMIMDMPFEPALQELDTIDLKVTTRFNVFMSMVELEHALDHPVLAYTNLTDSHHNDQLQIIQEIFPPFNN